MSVILSLACVVTTVLDYGPDSGVVRANRLEPGYGIPQPPRLQDPFRYFNSSPEVNRLAVMMYIRIPRSLRQIVDLVFERGIDSYSIIGSSHATPPFAIGDP
jgi:hypothetical protein